MPPLLFSPLEDPPVSDLWFQCVSAFLCGFCLAACSDPINSWPLTHTVNKHIEPSDFFLVIWSRVAFAPCLCNTFKYATCRNTRTLHLPCARIWNAANCFNSWEGFTLRNNTFGILSDCHANHIALKLNVSAYFTSRVQTTTFGM